MILPLLLLLFLATFTQADDVSPNVSPACHDKKIHEFPVTMKELYFKWYAAASAYELESNYEMEYNYTYGILDLSIINGKTKLTYWKGEIGKLEVVTSENATFMEHDDHVLQEDPLHGIIVHIHKVSDDCIKYTCYNNTESSHAMGQAMGYFLLCRSHRGNDADIEAFKQRAHCRNFNHILVRRYNFEYVSKCHSVAHRLDPLDVKSILGVWHLEAKAGKDDRILEAEDDPWTEFMMDGESLKIQEGHGSIKSSINEATVHGSKILMKHGSTSLVLTFYPTCKDCLLMRHEDESDGNVKLLLFRRSGKLTAEEVEKFKDNVRCLSLSTATVRQDTDMPEQKAKWTHVHGLSPACHSKKIHDFPITVKELHCKRYLVASAYELLSTYEMEHYFTYVLVDISIIEGKTKLTFWKGQNGSLEVVTSENATFVEHDDHVIIEDPMHGFRLHVHKVSDDCIMFTGYNSTDAIHAVGHVVLCRSHRGNDFNIEAFKQHSRCKNFNHIFQRRNDFEYASKCHSVAHCLDPLDVKSILGVWHMVAKAGKDDKILEAEDDPWTEFIMDGESLKIQEGHGSTKSSINEATINRFKILMKHGSTSFVLTFYPTCEDCLLMRHEDGSDGNVKLLLFRRSGKLTAEEVEKFKDNVRCLSLPTVNVLSENHKPKQKEEPEKSHS